jgi:carboxyl-terminal processing protease
MHGEFDSADSIKQNATEKYKTAMGRIVYGGGGIMPDIFIPRDTSGITSYFTNIINSGTLNLYALYYSDRNYNKLSSFKTYQDLYNYLQKQPLLAGLTTFAASKGIPQRPTLINISRQLLEKEVRAYIVRNFFDEAGFFPIYQLDDVTLKRAVQVLKEGKSNPTLNLKKKKYGAA